MRSGGRLLALLCLLVWDVCGQHSGSGGHPGGPGVQSIAPPTIGGRTFSGPGNGVLQDRQPAVYRPGPFRRGFRRGYIGGGYAPYFPISGYDYYGSYLTPYDENEASPSAGGTENVVIVQPDSAARIPATKPVIATPVIHEYKVEPKAAGAASPRPGFTIVLRDGSTRTAKASWVQGGQLHYVDTRSMQQVLAPGMIDRDATDRANQAKSLSMELPPG